MLRRENPTLIAALKTSRHSRGRGKGTEAARSLLSKAVSVLVRGEREVHSKSVVADLWHPVWRPEGVVIMPLFLGLQKLPRRLPMSTSLAGSPASTRRHIAWQTPVRRRDSVVGGKACRYRELPTV